MSRTNSNSDNVAHSCEGCQPDKHGRNREGSVVSKEISKKMLAHKGNRYSISMSGKTYDRLRVAVPRGVLRRGVSGFVDDILATALDDPEILARLVNKCQYDEASRTCSRSGR